MLAPDAAQHTALLRTVGAFNDACNWIAGVAYGHGWANKIELQKLVYYEARERFGLAAQMAIRAISKVVEASKRDMTTRPTFRRHGAMTYDERVLSFKGLDHVSILTLDGRVLVPMCIKEYFEARRDRIKGQADLSSHAGTFLCTIPLCKYAALADHNATRVLRKRARAAVMQPMVSDAPTGVAPETSPSL